MSAVSSRFRWRWQSALKRKTVRGAVGGSVSGLLERTLVALPGKMRLRMTSKSYRTETRCHPSTEEQVFASPPSWRGAHEDSHRRVRAAVLRKGGSLEEVFRPGDMVSFMRRQKTGGWIGQARVLACEGKNLWLLHAGIPILVASNRVRGANAEEHLEVELLNKHRLSRKRPFLDPGAVEQDHRLRAEGQVPYVDMREGGAVGGVPEPAGGDDSPKKARTEETAGFPRIIVEP